MACWMSSGGAVTAQNPAPRIGTTRLDQADVASAETSTMGQRSLGQPLRPSDTSNVRSDLAAPCGGIVLVKARGHEPRQRKAKSLHRLSRFADPSTIPAEPR